MEFNVFWGLIMIIDATNGKIINSKEVYIHDDILEEFYFNRTEKKLHLSILKANEFDSKKILIDFLHVIGFEMTSCDFWGSSPHILDFEYVEKNDNIIIPKLFEIKEKNDYTFCTLNNREEYIETRMTFSSGDQLIIACKSIII